MPEFYIFGIIYSVIALVAYTVTVGVGLYKARQIDLRATMYIFDIQKFINEVKHIMKKEEERMSKENYKDISENEMKEISIGDYLGKDMNESNYDLSISHLMNKKPTEDEYEYVLDLLTDLANENFKDYKFLIAKSPDETQQFNLVQIVSNWHDNPDVHKTIFRNAVYFGLNMDTLQGKFGVRVANGEVVNLGTDVTVITDDGTNSLPTGVSPINSGIEGGEIAFNVAFVRNENYEEWAKNNLPQEEDEDTDE